MAVWHFRISFVPRRGIVKIHGTIPNDLEAFKPWDGAGDIEKYEAPNYWSSPPRLNKNLVARIESLFARGDSWSHDALMFSSEQGHQVHVWDDNVSFKFDMRALDSEIFIPICKLAQDYDCLIALEENGQLIEPILEDLRMAAETSCAFQCLEDPEGYLKDLRRRRQSEADSP